MGAGATKRLSAVRWGVAGNIVVAWVLTIPAAALVAAALLVAGARRSSHEARPRPRQRGDLRAARRGRARSGSRSRRAVEQRFRDGRAGRTQEEVKALEHVGDQLVSELLGRSSTQFVTPVRPRGHRRRSRSRSTRSPTRSRTRRSCSGSTASSTPTRQSFELCALLVRATERARELLGGLKRLRGSAERDPRDQGDRGRGRPRRARCACEPLQGRPHRPGARDPLEGHLRGARGRGRRLRHGREPGRQHPRQERVAIR